MKRIIAPDGASVVTSLEPDGLCCDKPGAQNSWWVTTWRHIAEGRVQMNEGGATLPWKGMESSRQNWCGNLTLGFVLKAENWWVSGKRTQHPATGPLQEGQSPARGRKGGYDPHGQFQRRCLALLNWQLRSNWNDLEHHCGEQAALSNCSCYELNCVRGPLCTWRALVCVSGLDALGTARTQCRSDCH